jgi:hypothetical protein
MWARIKNGVVAEITDADPVGRFHPLLEWVTCGTDVLEGWLHSGGVFSEPLPVAAPVPSVVTMRQARLALLGAVMLADVELAIDAMPEAQRSAARIEWDYSSEVHRDKPFVAALAAALGLTDELLDELFIAAALL